MTTIIRLNVGGIYFDTTETTLQGSDFFKALLRNKETMMKGVIDGRYFIDRSGLAFEHVLSLLRNFNYFYPEEYLDELEFYMILNPTNIRPSKDKLNKKIEKLDNKILALQSLYIQLDLPKDPFNNKDPFNINNIKNIYKW